MSIGYFVRLARKADAAIVVVVELRRVGKKRLYSTPGNRQRNRKGNDIKKAAFKAAFLY